MRYPKKHVDNCFRRVFSLKPTVMIMFPKKRKTKASHNINSSAVLFKTIVTIHLLHFSDILLLNGSVFYRPVKRLNSFNDTKYKAIWCEV